jgi:hypothetical protein
LAHFAPFKRFLKPPSNLTVIFYSLNLGEI